MYDYDEDKRTWKIIAVIITIIIVSAIIGSYYMYLVMTKREDTDYVPYDGPGEYAKYYLKNDFYNEIIIEVDYMEGTMPDTGTLDYLVDLLDDVCEKNAIDYEISDEMDDSDQQVDYSIADIEQLKNKYQDYQNYMDTAVIHILFLNGYYEDSSITLGVSYHAGSCAIFKDRVDSIRIPRDARPFVSTDDFETSVVVHEVGHLLGLVNLNYDSDYSHEDKIHDSPNHCKNESCVMYYALEHSRESFRDKIYEQEDPRPPRTFGFYCMQDLEKLREEA
ncbi:MAG: hypothetical protein JSV49_05970 [Thermoplasmata archaeon]|nr:MAG: hypothetical protein JSV49_05970 [Thermoplasmata archaeon]